MSDVSRRVCIMIDNRDAQWKVTTSDNYTTVKIKSGSKWNAKEYIDPNTGRRMLQIFRVGGKFNALQLIKPKEEVYTPNGNAADNEESGLKFFYTTPEDSHTPPIKIPVS